MKPIIHGESIASLQPRYDPQAKLWGIFSLVCLVIAMMAGGWLLLLIIPAFFLGILTLNAFRVSSCGLWIYEGGLRIKTPGSWFTRSARWPGKQNVDISMGQLENFGWDAEDIQEENDSGLDHHQEIRFQIVWNDENGVHQELEWTADFNPGTIELLQEATPRLEEAEESFASQDDYWDS
jgi:hypothetical protein